MNWHYIEYMIKERRKQEEEECKRRRMINAAGYTNTNLFNEVFKLLLHKMILGKKSISYRIKSLSIMSWFGSRTTK